MNDSHATVVTKYFAKITILFLQCILACRSCAKLNWTGIEDSTLQSAFLTPKAAKFIQTLLKVYTKRQISLAPT